MALESCHERAHLANAKVGGKGAPIEVAIIFEAGRLEDDSNERPTLGPEKGERESGG